MIKLLKFHFVFLLSKKVSSVLVAVLIICLVMFFLFSKGYLPFEELQFHSVQYKEDYFLEAIGLLKLIIILVVIFSVFNGFIINDYLVFLYIRANHFKVMLSRIFFTLLLNIMFVLSVYLSFVILGLINTVFAFTFHEIISLFINLELFTIFYTMFSIIIITIYRQVYGLLIVFVFYIISMFSSDYNTSLENISSFSKAINLFISDLIYTGSFSYQFVYGNVYVLSMILLFFIAYALYVKRTDIM